MLIHISGNYPYHSLFSELVRTISGKSVAQRVIVPMRNNEGKNVNALSLPNVELSYINMYDNLDRLLYFRKMRRGYQRLLEVYPQWSASDVIIAHTAFSDGGLAYRLFRQFGIPYAVCVRNTDINGFLKFKPYFKSIFTKILLNAQKVIILSPCYLKRILSYFDVKDLDNITRKIISIPNGIHPSWFRSMHTDKTAHDTIQLIFVGELSKNKNVRTILSALDIIEKQGILYHFHIVGDGNQRKHLDKTCQRLGITSSVTFHGWKETKEELLLAYRSADIFIMPSLRETFGTVYLEAMTQGLPCIYTRGEGIDGWFKDGEIGQSVSPLAVNEIVDAIKLVMNQYNSISACCIQKVMEFQWDIIADKYLHAAGVL